MRKITILSFLIFNCSFAQESEIWQFFCNADSTLIGFKDGKQNVKIEPKFGRISNAYKFDKIMAVSEPNEKSTKYYHLTKSGKKVGIDSLYIFDNGFDCENEGFIRFKDNKNDKVGLFDANGNIAIPAVYSAISRVHNGMLFTLKDATKIQDGEHFFWKDGTQSLIDTKNNVLIENFRLSENINLYSIRIEDKLFEKEGIRDYFEGKNGKTYSFINYEKEFKFWLETVFKSDLNSEKITHYSFEKISYWDDDKGWIMTKNNEISTDIMTMIIKKLSAVNDNSKVYRIFNESLNPYIYETNEFDMFFNNCYESLQEKYPVMNVVIDGRKRYKYVQDQFEFLRTENGYKLVGVSIRSN